MSRNNSPREPKGKSTREMKVEMITWFLLVMVFGVINILPEDTNLPNWVVPIVGAIILVGSGLYQLGKGWHVSPVTWFAGFLMIFFGVYALYWNPERDFLGASLITFAIVIGFGIVTGET